MKNIDFATATRLDLEIWDTQNKIYSFTDIRFKYVAFVSIIII